MSLKTKLIDGDIGTSVKISTLGQLITAPLDFSTPVFHNMTLISTAYNFSEPRTGKKGVITDIIITGDKNIGANGSLIEIYCADSATDTTALVDILSVTLAKNASLVLTGLNWQIAGGVWVNAKMDDNNVGITLAGYYINDI